MGVYDYHHDSGRSDRPGGVPVAEHVQDVALIIRNRMYTKLKDEEEELPEKPNYMNVPASIRELEKIEMIRQADGVYRLDHAVTATQKTILKAFGIDTNYVKRKAREISDQLNPKVLKVRI